MYQPRLPFAVQNPLARRMWALLAQERRFETLLDESPTHVRDRIGVALSGGKDSLSLLRLLDWRRKSVPQCYELVVLHIIGDARGPDCPSHPPLLTWLEESGYQFAVEPVIIPADETLPMNCQRCTRNRRRTLFQGFQEMGCNVIAFGHHADDISLEYSLFFKHLSL